MCPYDFRPRKPNQKLRRKRTRNGEKEELLLNTAQGSLTSSNVRLNFLGTCPPRKKRSAYNEVNAKDKQLQKTPSTGISNVPSIVSDNPLSRLKPPSKSEGFITRDEHLDFLNKTTSVLIFEIENAQDATQMVDISSTTFTLLDKIGVDYLSLYKSVCSCISLQHEKELLYKEKPTSAFDTKALHEEISCRLSDFNERKPGVVSKVEATEHELASITADLHRLEEEVRTTKEKKATCEANLAAAQAEKAVFDKSHSEEVSKFVMLDPQIAEAQVAIDNFERRQKETVDALNYAKEELLRLTK